MRPEVAVHLRSGSSASSTPWVLLLEVLLQAPWLEWWKRYHERRIWSSYIWGTTPLLVRGFGGGFSPAQFNTIEVLALHSSNFWQIQIQERNTTGAGVTPPTIITPRSICDWLHWAALVMAAGSQYCSTTSGYLFDCAEMGVGGGTSAGAADSGGGSLKC
jgi:hypothetical protein